MEECRYYLLLARDLGYADTREMLDSIDEVSRMLESYIRAVASSRLTLRSFFWLLAPGFWLLP